MVDEDLEPKEPEEAGVEEKTPDQTRIEGAHLLANQAEERLGSEGFDQAQLHEWAKTYIAEEESGDVDAFVEWIAEQEDQDGS